MIMKKRTARKALRVLTLAFLFVGGFGGQKLPAQDYYDLMKSLDESDFDVWINLVGNKTGWGMIFHTKNGEQGYGFVVQHGENSPHFVATAAIKEVERISSGFVLRNENVELVFNQYPEVKLRIKQFGGVVEVFDLSAQKDLIIEISEDEVIWRVPSTIRYTYWSDFEWIEYYSPFVTDLVFEDSNQEIQAEYSEEDGSSFLDIYGLEYVGGTSRRVRSRIIASDISNRLSDYNDGKGVSHPVMLRYHRKIQKEPSFDFWDTGTYVLTNGWLGGWIKNDHMDSIRFKAGNNTIGLTIEPVSDAVIERERKRIKIVSLDRIFYIYEGGERISYFHPTLGREINLEKGFQYEALYGEEITFQFLARAQQVYWNSRKIGLDIEVTQKIINYLAEVDEDIEDIEVEITLTGEGKVVTGYLSLGSQLPHSLDTQNYLNLVISDHEVDFEDLRKRICSLCKVISSIRVIE